LILRLALPLLLVAAVMNPAHADQPETVTPLTSGAAAHAQEPEIVVEPSTNLAPPTAQTPDEETALPSITRQATSTHTWYGWQTLLADGAGLSAAVACAALFENHDSGALCYLPFLGASAVVHVAHHNPGRAALSFAMMTLLPIVGGAIGNATADCGKDTFLCGLGETIVGAGVGLATAMTLDAAFAFSTEETPRPIAHRGPSFMPTLAVNPSGGAGVGLAGRF